MTATPPTRTRLNFQELMSRWNWNENDIRDALVNEKLTPSYFISGAVWQLPVTETGERTRQGVSSVFELMYLTEFRAAGGPLDGYFYRCAREPDALGQGGEVFEVGGIGVERSRISLSQVILEGAVTMEEVLRFESSHPQQKVIATEKPLGKRERDTLLCIIAVLCKEAKLEYKTAAKTAGLIYDLAIRMAVSIGETTIEEHLKKIPDALGTRMK